MKNQIKISIYTLLLLGIFTQRSLEAGSSLNASQGESPVKEMVSSEEGTSSPQEEGATGGSEENSLGLTGTQEAALATGVGAGVLTGVGVATVGGLYGLKLLYNKAYSAFKLRKKVEKFKKKLDDSQNKSSIEIKEYNDQMKKLNDADKALVDEVNRILRSNPEKNTTEHDSREQLLGILEKDSLLEKRDGIPVLLETAKDEKNKTIKKGAGSNKNSLAAVILSGSTDPSLKLLAQGKKDSRFKWAQQKKTMETNLSRKTSLSGSDRKKSKLKYWLDRTGVWRDDKTRKNRIKNRAQAKVISENLVERKHASRAERTPIKAK